MTAPARPLDTAADPLGILKAFTGLRQIVSLYPGGHPIVEQALQQVEDALAPALRDSPEAHVDLIRGDAHLNGVPYRLESRQQPGVIQEFTALGADSIHFRRGVSRDELRTVAELLAYAKDRGFTEPVGPAIERAGVAHVTIARLVELDTRWMSQEWPDAPTGPLDPDYAESLRLAQETFGAFASGSHPGVGPLRDLLQLLMVKVAGSNAALGQILAVKQYENHTYCHSVNVAILALLLGRQIGLDQTLQAALVEGALLHDVGKTRVPLDILRKPGALDARERRAIERHAADGALVLMDVPGLHPLTPMMALEHHRHNLDGGGYPDLGNARPHPLSRIVSVADVYEAATGARAYRPPLMPEEACLVLARLSARSLDPVLVKAFVNAVTFFPVGTIVRTTLEEAGVVVRLTPGDPLHPVIALVEDLDPNRPTGVTIDLSDRDGSGAYRRHVTHSVRPSRSVYENR